MLYSNDFMIIILSAKTTETIETVESHFVFYFEKCFFSTRRRRPIINKILQTFQLLEVKFRETVQ